MNKQENFSVFMVLGPPGSGKGTQIKLLADKLGFFHFISSKIGREYIKTHNDSETLKQKERYDTGLLFDAKWMFKVIKEKTEEIFNDKDNCKGIIYDGSPRTLYEAENLYDFLVKLIDKENIKIIEIDAKEKELRKRIKKRKRDLDKEEIFNVRIRVYKEETLPGLEFLKKKHKIIVINGDQSIEKVHKDIVEKLNT
ncbi:nucleoside monophosphate kinase [Patescibacteria group bacterium]|nr:nucleoside monophosphate kinase [Patescibacteria group bacterium]